MSRIMFLVVLGVLTVSGRWSPASDEDFFEKSVRPLLIRRCLDCHSGSNPEGGLSLATAKDWQRGGDNGPVIVPHEPESSSLVSAIHYRSLEMPPADAGGKLSEAEIAILTKWIADGAFDPREHHAALGGMGLEEAKAWWSFQPLGRADPNLTIDWLIRQQMETQKLTAARPADKRTLIRRATYDLTGLPPTANEVNEFVNDLSADAFSKVIDRLLASPQYGAHWGRRWLDVVRYADTAGENSDRPLPHAWKYRNWVIDAWNRDLPFDQFVRLQIAGDMVAEKSHEQLRNQGIIATGYLAIARRYGHDIDKEIHLMHEDVIDNLGKAFLGLSLGCARCHDHKYDPITADDYYALYGVFQSTRFAFPGCEPKGQPRDLIPLVGAEELERLNARYQRQMAQFQQQSLDLDACRQRIKELAGQSYEVLFQSNVPETETRTVDQGQTIEGELVRSVKAGEYLQLAVSPNGNHGADTTRIRWTITRLGSQAQRWDTDDLIPRISAGEGPMLADQGAKWLLLDVADGPLFLAKYQSGIDGKPELSKWSANGDLPSVFVNQAVDAVEVWTSLPPQALFVHPDHQRDVAIGWICPEDGKYKIEGSVGDAHPAPSLDGVSFRLEHFTSSEFAAEFESLYRATFQQPKEPQPPAIPVAYAVTEGEASDALFQRRGDPEQLGNAVPRRWLSVFGGQVVPATSGSGRRHLADWIAEQPLTARVMVNRIWQGHFGRGLVATSNDFGARGQPPTHPELLEWLTAMFRDGGYRIKPMHRMIMLSDAYQRSCQAPAESVQRDPDNHWLARFSRRRLRAEEIRDSLMQVAGQLDWSVGQSHPFPPESTWTFTQHAPFHAVYPSQRRSVYLMVQRQRRHPFLALFDGADPNSSSPQRSASILPSQSLYFLNDPFFHQQARRLAEQLLEHPNDERSLIAYQQVFQRSPTAEEQAICRRLISNYPGQPIDQWSALVRVLMSSNEFLYVD